MKTIATDRAPKAIGPYSQAAQAGEWLFISGQLGMDAATNTLAASFEDQARLALGNLRAILAAAGLNPGHVVKVTVFIKDLNRFAAFNELYAASFAEPYPAREVVEVSRLPKDALIEISAIASRAK